MGDGDYCHILTGLNRPSYLGFYRPLLDESPYAGSQAIKLSIYAIGRSASVYRPIADRHWTRLPPELESGKTFNVFFQG